MSTVKGGVLTRGFQLSSCMLHTRTEVSEVSLTDVVSRSGPPINPSVPKGSGEVGNGNDILRAGHGNRSSLCKDNTNGGNTDTPIAAGAGGTVEGPDSKAKSEQVSIPTCLPTPSSVHRMKGLVEVIPARGRHWVGDAFYVHGMFGFEGDFHKARGRSPFLLVDYGEEMVFKPNKDTEKPRGVGTHPHKGFETVTIAYQGEVEHRDSTGGGGVIRAGDCQWMTAGRGIQHSEYHSAEFSKHGGKFEMMQLWVNLPKRFKNTKPRYQNISSSKMVEIPLPNDGGVVSLIAGELEGKKGPAKTFTPMNVWNLYLKPNGVADLPQPEGWTTIIAVLNGYIRVNGIDVGAHELIHLSNEGTGVRIEAKGKTDIRALFLSGEPIDEPIAGEGPFVMNTDSEVRQAIADFRRGKF